MKFLITGGAGFIGSAMIRHIINNTDHSVINIDKLTYAGNLESLESIETSEKYVFEHVDICDTDKIERIFNQYQPDIVMHLAAESHVDRSIDGPYQFIQTNIVGTYVLLEKARNYWSRLEGDKKNKFRFHHVSTDEVYGDLEDKNSLFTENTSYDPSSPYSASKASSDHLVRAWQRTFSLPTVITNCSNNYGPYQFPEKLIPLIIINALKGKELPIYGDGKQIRDWLYVDDHNRGVDLILDKGKTGETYNIGGNNEWTNIDIVNRVCDLIHEEFSQDRKLVQRFPNCPSSRGNHPKILISHVKDRLGHDRRYAVNADKISSNLGYSPGEDFKTGLPKTLQWFLAQE